MNRLWANLIVEELVRCGVRQFFVAPGSRSTPLTTAVAARSDIQVVQHWDERALAFAALGAARVTGRPAVWITTSGTAVANGLPAVVEASMDGVPLVLLTADRPPELRETAANQTIRQPGLFGSEVRWFFDLPAPGDDMAPDFVLSTVDQAVHRACHPDPGPVHLNCMFREPLAPDPAPDAPFGVPASLRRWQSGTDPFTRYEAGVAAPASLPVINPDRRGLVVVGKCSGADAESAMRLAEHLGWPCAADIRSGLRLRGPRPGLITMMDLLLGARDDWPTVECVLQFGAPPVSKRLLRYLAASRPATWVVIENRPRRIDPAHAATHRVTASISATAGALQANSPKGRPSDWTTKWSASERAARGAVHGLLSGESWSEPAIARHLIDLVDGDDPLFLGSSMPIRLADAFALAESGPQLIGANRGASGIDGAISTAAGMAAASGRPATALLGDLSFLHDLNALDLLRRHPVIVVVINNDGGGIFSLLPIARHADVFEPFFGTPHGLQTGPFAEGFGLASCRPASIAEMAEAYREARASGASAVIELVTDRSRLTTDLDAVVQEVRDALAR